MGFFDSRFCIRTKLKNRKKYRSHVTSTPWSTPCAHCMNALQTINESSDCSTRNSLSDETAETESKYGNAQNTKQWRGHCEHYINVPVPNGKCNSWREKGRTCRRIEQWRVVVGLGASMRRSIEKCGDNCGSSEGWWHMDEKGCPCPKKKKKTELKRPQLGKTCSTCKKIRAVPSIVCKLEPAIGVAARFTYK